LNWATRVFATAALAVVAFAASGCGSSRALPGLDGQVGAAGARDAAAGAGGAWDGGHRADAAPDSAGTSGDGGTAGWPLVLRVINGGATDVLLPENLTAVCVFSISLAPVAGGDSRLLSATPPDSWCDCARCATTGRRVCDSTDFICDGPPTKLAPGAHLDIAWDRQVAVTASAPPPDSTCPFFCDHWETVVPGDYTFTIQTLSGAFTAQAALASSTDLIALAINR